MIKKNEKNITIPSHLQFENVSQATKLLEKRRILYEVDEAYEQQKEEFRRQKIEFNKQEEMIKEKDFKIQESLLNFCKFLSKNKNKMDRDDKRYKQEKEIYEMKKNEIEKEKIIKDKLEEHNIILTNKVNILENYQTFLEKVKNQNSDQFTDISELLQRHNILEESNKNLKEKKNLLFNENTKLSNKISDYKKEKENEILLFNNHIAKLQNDLEELEIKKSISQNKIEDSMNLAYNKMLDLGKILMAIDNIHSKCSKTKFKFINKNDDDISEYESENIQNYIKKGKNVYKNKEKEIDINIKNIKYETYIEKSEIAVNKLKQIRDYLDNFKKIIEIYNENKK